MPPTPSSSNVHTSGFPGNAPPPHEWETQTGFDPVGSVEKDLSLWDRVKSLFGNPARQAAVAAVFYGLDGLAEFAEMNEMMGTPEYFIYDAAFIGVAVGLPTILMLWRRGYVSAGVLSAVAIINALSSYQAMQAGNPMYDASSVIYNLFFLAAFGRAAWYLWKSRKAETSA